MPRPFRSDMELLTAEEVERIYQVVDALDLHRDWVVVPLNCAEEGREILCPDGKILLRAPGGARFEEWLATLRERIESLDLAQVPRRWDEDPKRPLTGLFGPKFVGTRNYLPPEQAA